MTSRRLWMRSSAPAPAEASQFGLHSWAILYNPKWWGVGEMVGQWNALPRVSLIPRVVCVDDTHVHVSCYLVCRETAGASCDAA